MIIGLPRTKLESVYAMYGCLTAYRLRMGLDYLVKNGKAI